MRACSSAKLASSSGKFGISTPASRAVVFLAKSQESWTWRVSANMSGKRRVFSSTAGSILRAAAWASALVNMAARLVSMRVKTGTEAWYMESVIHLPLGLAV